jgi:hypothetical protein
MIAYTVRCTFTDESVADEWIAWLRDEHIADVCGAGALDGKVVRLDRSEGEPLVCEVRYHFASRESMETYERDHAPRLRAEGLERFPLERGLAYERSVGEIVA